MECGSSFQLKTNNQTRKHHNKVIYQIQILKKNGYQKYALCSSFNKNLIM